LPDDKALLKYLSGETKASLISKTVGLDRGVAVPVHAGYKAFDFTKEQKQSTTKSQRYIKWRKLLDFEARSFMTTKVFEKA